LLLRLFIIRAIKLPHPLFRPRRRRRRSGGDSGGGCARMPVGITPTS
jgi:hypothetical protein